MYNKPMIVPNDDMAEGVYVASGANCWSGDIRSTQSWNGSHNVFQLDLVHSSAVEHISNAVTVTVKFSNTITDAYTENGWSCWVSGNVVTVTRPQHANAYKSGDNVSFKLWAKSMDQATTEALSASITGFSCDKAVNVQGGGADGN